MTLKDFENIKINLPDDMDLWLTAEGRNSLKVNICYEDLQNVKGILYKDFLKKNPSFLNFT